MSNTELVGKVHVADVALEPWPLPPEAILAGVPDARGTVVSRAEGGRVVRGLWACTPGTFRWSWNYDESLVVISGRARVRVDGGPVVEIGPGDYAWFARGQQSTWEILEPLRKAFHAHAAEPLPW